MRLAARSNWLWAMALPDIGARAGAVTNDLRGSGAGSDGMQAPAGSPGRRMLDFGHRLHGVGHPLAGGPQVGFHTGNEGPTTTICPTCQPRSPATSSRVATSVSSLGATGPGSGASTATPVWANHSSAGASWSGRRGA